MDRDNNDSARRNLAHVMTVINVILLALLALLYWLNSQASP